MANSTNKPNDFIAASINSGENITLDDLYYYNITPDNTGIQSEDYYKRIPQIQELFTKDGKFDEALYDAWYKDNLDLYNLWSNEDYEGKLIDAIERSPYDIFHTDNTNVEDTSTRIISARDPERTARGLTHTGSNNGATFDIREVAQANYVLDENGNELDWTPNDKGGFWKGLWRPALALATWDEDGYHYENGMKVEHHTGDIRYGSNGDPCYQILGNKSAVGKDVLHYSDTFTADDSFLNKFDFFDNDGLKKSIGGTVARTAFMLAPMLIPGVNTVIGWGGAALALAETAPILLRSINGLALGDNDNDFGKAMNSWENFFSRFNSSTSREAQSKFFSKESLADMVISSANQLFQQRNIINGLGKLFEKIDVKNAQKIGSALSLGYMAATSSPDAYATFKEAGMNDRVASAGTLAVFLGLYGMMSSGYIFKDAMFRDTWLAEDQNRRQLLKTLADYGKANLTVAQQQAAREAGLGLVSNTAANRNWFMKMVGATKRFFTKGQREYQQMLEKAATDGDILSVQMAKTPFWQRLIGRGLNEGIEETMEEGVTDSYKLFAQGLDWLGVDVTEKNKDLDFKETWADILGRYATAFLGGMIGGMTFEGFSEWNKLAKNHFKKENIDRGLITNLVQAITNPEMRSELDDEINKMEKKGLWGNKNLSARVSAIYDDNDPRKISNVIFGEGTDEDNQNKALANTARYLIGNIKRSIEENGIKEYDVIAQSTLSEFLEKAENKGMSLKDFLKSEGVNWKVFEMSKKGALDGVYSEMIDKSVDIITLDLAIKNRKAELKNEAGSDANKEEANQSIKEDETIKQLEKEKAQAKKDYDELASGKRTDYYASVIDFASDATKMMPYIVNENLFGKDDGSVLPWNNAQNYVKFKYNVDITDPNISQDYKDAKIKEWENYKNSVLPKLIWRAHQLHYNISENLAGKLTSIEQQLQGYKNSDPFEDFDMQYEAMLETVDTSLDTNIAISENPEWQSHLTELKTKIKEAKTDLAQAKQQIAELSDLRDAESQRKKQSINDALLQRYNEINELYSTLVPYREQLQYLKSYYQKLINNKIISNTDLSNMINFSKFLAGEINECNHFDENAINTIKTSLPVMLMGLIHEDYQTVKLDNSVTLAQQMAMNAKDADGHYIGFAKVAYELLAKFFNIDPASDLEAEIKTRLENETIKNIVISLFYARSLPKDLNGLKDFIRGEYENLEPEQTGNVLDPLLDSLLAHLTDSRMFNEFVDSLKNFIEFNFTEPSIPNSENRFLWDSAKTGELKTTMDALEAALKNGDFKSIRTAIDSISDFIAENIPGELRDMFKQYLFCTINSDGNIVQKVPTDIFDKLLEICDEENGIFYKLTENPIWDLLAQIDTYTNNKFTIAINRVKSEIDRYQALGANAEDEYVINELEISAELNEVKKLFGLVEAQIGSAVDGHNALVNQYRGLVGASPFAIMSENSRRILAMGMQNINNIINHLLAISKKNSDKQLRMQMDTHVNCVPKLAKATSQFAIDLINTIKTHVEQEKQGKSEEEQKKIEESSWLFTEDEIKELEFTLNDNITPENYVDEQKRINEFYSRLREIILQKSKALKNSEGNAYGSEENAIENLLLLAVEHFDFCTATQTEFSPTTALNEITQWTAFQNFVIVLLEDVKKVDAIYNSARSLPEFKEIYPFMGQEFMLKNAYVVGKHTWVINSILEKIGAKANFFKYPADSQIEGYVRAKKPLGNVIHFDGTAGAGKTELTRMLGAMFKMETGNDVHQVYSAINQDHVDKNLKPRLGSSYSYINLSEVLSKAIKDKELIKNSQIIDLNKEIEENIDKNWYDINPFKNVNNDVKIWVIDEDGFVNPWQWLIISKIAEKAGALIVGTGDSYQNGAQINSTENPAVKTPRGLDDLIIWNNPFLSISMRAQNRGKLLNQQLIYSLIKDSINKLETPWAVRLTAAANAAKTVLSAQHIIRGYKSNTGEVFGEISVDSTDSAVELAKKLAEIVKTKNVAEPDDKKNHTLVIVTDKEKVDRWKIDELSNRNDVVIMDKDSVQGGQADYVIVDRSDWSDNPFLALKDFYTMSSRSKIGTVFVKDEVFSDQLNFVFKESEDASYTPDKTQKERELEKYNTWRNELFTKTSGFWDPKNGIVQSSVTTSNASPTNPSINPTNPTTPTNNLPSTNGQTGNGAPGAANNPPLIRKGNYNSVPEKTEEELIEQARKFRGDKIESAVKSQSVVFDLQNYLDELSDYEDKTNGGIKSNCATILKNTKDLFLPSVTNADKFKTLKLLAKIIVQHNALKISDGLSEGVKRKLALTLNTDAINALDAALSGKPGYETYFYFKNTDPNKPQDKLGIFIIKKGNESVFIPAFKIVIENQSKSSFILASQIHFGEIDKTRKSVSSKGVIRKPVSEVFPDLDVNVAILTDGKKEGTNWELKVDALDFSNRNLGKAFFIIPRYSGYDFTHVIDPERNENKIDYLIATKNGNGLAELIGVQQTIDIDAFLKIVEAKHIIMGSTKETTSEEVEAALETIKFYWGETGATAYRTAAKKLRGEDGSTKSKDSLAQAYEIVRPYSALHWTSVSKLFSAILRFLDQNNGQYRNLKKDIYSILWNLLNDFSETNKYSYKSAISLNFNGVNIIFDPIPGEKYRIILSKGKNDFKTVGIIEGSEFNLKEYYEATGNNGSSAFDLAKKLLDAVRTKLDNFSTFDWGDTFKDLWYIDTQEIDDSRIEPTWKDGDFSLGFCKIKTENENSESNVTAIYQAFEEDISRLFSDIFVKAKAAGIEKNNFTEKLRNFLETDSIFKYQLYANIAGKEIDKNPFWLEAEIQNTALTTDVIAYFEPAYTVTIGQPGSTNMSWQINTNPIDNKYNDENLKNVQNEIKKFDAISEGKSVANWDPKDDVYRFSKPIIVHYNNKEYKILRFFKEDGNLYIGYESQNDSGNIKFSDNRELFNIFEKEIHDSIEDAYPTTVKIEKFNGTLYYNDNGEQYQIIGIQKDNGNIVSISVISENSVIRNIDVNSELAKKIESKNEGKLLSNAKFYSSVFAVAGNQIYRIHSGTNVGEAYWEIYQEGKDPDFDMNPDVEVQLKEINNDFGIKPQKNPEPPKGPKLNISELVKDNLNKQGITEDSYEISIGNSGEITVNFKDTGKPKWTGTINKASDGTYTIIWNAQSNLDKTDFIEKLRNLSGLFSATNGSENEEFKNIENLINEGKFSKAATEISVFMLGHDILDDGLWKLMEELEAAGETKRC